MSVASLASSLCVSLLRRHVDHTSSLCEWAARTFNSHKSSVAFSVLRQFGVFALASHSGRFCFIVHTSSLTRTFYGVQCHYGHSRLPYSTWVLINIMKKICTRSLKTANESENVKTRKNHSPPTLPGDLHRYNNINILLYLDPFNVFDSVEYKITTTTNNAMSM